MEQPCMNIYPLNEHFKVPETQHSHKNAKTSVLLDLPKQVHKAVMPGVVDSYLGKVLVIHFFGFGHFT